MHLHQCLDSRNENCSPDHCAVIGCPHKKWACVECRCEPDAFEQKRIDYDLANTKGASPVAWYCPTCAPDLCLAPSGLAWDVVIVGGASPR